MKKLCAVLSAVLLLFFLGCAGVPAQPVLVFEADMHIDSAYTGGVTDIEAHIKASETTMEITVATPDELQGLTYKWSEDFELSLRGLLVQADKGYLPDKAFAKAVYSVLSGFSADSQYESFVDGVALYRGNSGVGEYTLTTDKAGYIQNISIEEIKLSADFTYNKQ